MVVNISVIFYVYSFYKSNIILKQKILCLFWKWYYSARITFRNFELTTFYVEDSLLCPGMLAEVDKVKIKAVVGSNHHYTKHDIFNELYIDHFKRFVFTTWM